MGTPGRRDALGLLMGGGGGSLLSSSGAPLVKVERGLGHTEQFASGPAFWQRGVGDWTALTATVLVGPVHAAHTEAALLRAVALPARRGCLGAAHGQVVLGALTWVLVGRRPASALPCVYSKPCARA